MRASRRLLGERIGVGLHLLGVSLQLLHVCIGLAGVSERGAGELDQSQRLLEPAVRLFPGTLNLRAQRRRHAPPRAPARGQWGRVGVNLELIPQDEQEGNRSHRNGVVGRG
jgi:hypothetical protein